MTTLFTILHAAGFIVTATGLACAYCAATKTLREANSERRVRSYLNADHAARRGEIMSRGGELDELLAENERSVEAHRQAGHPLLTTSEATIEVSMHTRVPDHEKAVGAAGTGLLWAGTGLLLSTAASIWSLWVVA